MGFKKAEGVEMAIDLTNGSDWFRGIDLGNRFPHRLIALQRHH